MVDAPERIWAGDFHKGLGHCTAGMQGGLYEEYTRADIAERDLAEARENASAWHRQCQTVATILELPEPDGTSHAETVRTKFESLQAELAEARNHVAELELERARFVAELDAVTLERDANHNLAVANEERAKEEHRRAEAAEADLAEARAINANLMGDDEDKPRYTTKRLKQEVAKAVEAAEAERDRLAAELAQERMDRDEKIAQASAKADYEAERAGDIENENDRLAAALRPLERHVALNCYDRQIEGGWEKSEALVQLLDDARASLQTGEQKPSLPTATCPDCDGHGIMHGYDADCPTCGGSGKVALIDTEVAGNG